METGRQAGCINVLPEIAALIPMYLAERHNVIPLACNEGRILLAMATVDDVNAIDAVQAFTGCAVEVQQAAAEDIFKAINCSYSLEEALKRPYEQHMLRQRGLTGAVQNGGIAAGIVDVLLMHAIHQQASDIHLDPAASGLKVRFRIDGQLHFMAVLPANIQQEVLSRLKIMAGMDIAEKRRPQDGRIRLQDFGSDIDIRAGSLPLITGEKLALRILDRRAVNLSVQALGFSPRNLQQYKWLYTRPYGIAIISGPTGAGKTTTLYAALVELVAEAKNIVSIEDPVEYQLQGINQVQVNSKAGVGFANGLRAILRQDPDIIMLGEIRDSETARTAISAAMTGHLVLTTMHTNDAPGAVTRLLDMGIEPYLVASCVLGVIAQRLVRCICSNCCTEDTENHFKKSENYKSIKRYHGRGCQACLGSGYRGRMAIHEVMVIDDVLRSAICQVASTGELYRIACQQGMVTLEQDGFQKAAAGLTTLEEIMAVSQLTAKEQVCTGDC